MFGKDRHLQFVWRMYLCTQTVKGSYLVLFIKNLKKDHKKEVFSFMPQRMARQTARDVHTCPSDTCYEFFVSLEAIWAFCKK